MSDIEETATGDSHDTRIDEVSGAVHTGSGDIIRKLAEKGVLVVKALYAGISGSFLLLRFNRDEDTEMAEKEP